MPFLFWLDVAALSISTVLATALFLMVLGVGPKRTINRLFALFVLTQALRAAFSLLLRLGLWLESGNTSLWSEISALSLALMGPLLFLFVTRYVRHRSLRVDIASVSGLAAIAILAVPLFRHQLIFNQHLEANGSTVLMFSTWGLIVTGIPAFFIAWSTILLWRERRRLAEPYLALGSAILLAGFIVGGILEAAFSVLSITNMAGMLLLGYAVINRQIFNPLQEHTVALQKEIAERIRIEESLREKTWELDHYFSHALDLLCIADMDGYFKRLNKEWETTLGYPIDELEGQRFFDFVHPDDKESTLEAVSCLADGKHVLNFVNRYRHKDGSYRWIEWRSLSMGKRIYAVARDITGHKQIEDEIRQRNTELTILNQAGQALNRLVDPTEIIELIYAMTGWTLDNKNLWVALIDETSGQIRYPLQTIDGRRQETPQTFCDDLMKYVLRTEMPLSIPSGVGEMLKSLDILWVGREPRSLMAVPMLAGEKGVGVIIIQDPEKENAYQDTQVDLLMMIATQAAGALENAWLYQQAQQEIIERKRAEEMLNRRATQLSILNDVGKQISAVLDPESVLDRAAQLIQQNFDYHHVAIFIVDHAQARAVMNTRAGSFVDLFPPVHTLKLGQGMVGWVAQRGERLLANDVRTEPRHVNFFPDVLLTRSELDVPIKIGQEIVGVLDVQSPQLDDFDEDDVMVIETLAGQIATAIENARLYASAQQELAERRRAEETLRQYAVRLKTLRDIDQAILAAETHHAIAQAAVEHLYELIPCQRISVSLLDRKSDEVEQLITLVHGETRVGAGSRFSYQDYGIADVETLCDEVVVIEDWTPPQKLPKLARQLRDEGIRSTVNIPLSYRGKVVGWLNLGSTEPSAFDDEKIEIAREVANQLGIAIRQAYLHEQIQQHAVELENYAADRTAELTIAYQDLKALSHVKDVFVSNVSHELRTPVTSLKLFVYLLNQRPEKRDSYIVSLKHEVDRLDNLIEGLLMLSRLDQDRVEMNLALLDINNLVEEYVIDRAPLAESHHLKLELEKETEMPEIRGDRHLLGQVLSILMTNAFNYTPEEGRVTVSTFKGDNACECGFCVVDTGPGISHDEQTCLFDRFYRGNAARQANTPGTGLGLSIAKEIVDRHNGRIEVTSHGIPGQGTRFSVWLPTNTSVETE
ncbi:MAG: GAF domain-containing protein [Anaerolineae bacterium]|nr:GAF domain-containing protein [Anaerolineae bacterium]